MSAAMPACAPASQPAPAPGAGVPGGAGPREARVRLVIPPAVDPALVAGPGDVLLRRVEERFDGTARVTLRGDTVTIAGSAPEVAVLERLFSEVVEAVAAGERPDAAFVDKTLELLREDAFAPRDLRGDVILTHGGRTVRPKTAGQKRLVDAVRTHEITFGLGPAGTGKTYLAVALAVAALERREVGRIVLARPVVEAGESLGFLPGTLEEKVDPYVRPLYDALYDMMDRDRVKSLLDLGTIEIAPLAFMRGRTFSQAFVILDEAQNATPEQVKMFLTRLGFGSRFVVTGDLTQSDLPGGRSCLAETRRILGGVDGIAFVDLTGADIVRHNLVAKIVAAYDAAATRDNRNQHTKGDAR